MTGYGRAEEAAGNKTFLIEIKSLNGKQFDLNLKLTPLLRPSEFAIRSLLSEQLLRGTIECTVSLKKTAAAAQLLLTNKWPKPTFNH